MRLQFVLLKYHFTQKFTHILLFILFIHYINFNNYLQFIRMITNIDHLIFQSETNRKYELKLMFTNKCCLWQ